MSWWGSFRAKPQAPAREPVSRQGSPSHDDAAATEAAIVTGLAAGHPEALAAAYDRHGQSVYRFAFALTASRDTAEEVTQEVFLFLLREWRRYDPARGSLEGWLIGIARTLARKRLAEVARSEARVHEADSGSVARNGDDVAAAPGDDALEELLATERRRLLHEAIMTLPEAYREALVLHALCGMPYEAVAQQLGCPVGTVRSRIARAKERLAKMLADLQEAATEGPTLPRLAANEVPPRDRKGEWPHAR
jgi:RNA polymerase sigma factor (sigma-70 family)